MHYFGTGRNLEKSLYEKGQGKWRGQGRRISTMGKAVKSSKREILGDGDVIGGGEGEKGIAPDRRMKT